jgi:hypothetical protein
MILRYDNGPPAVYGESAPAEILPNRDYVVEFDVQGDLLRLRIWPVGSKISEVAQVTVSDFLHREGAVGLGHYACEADAYLIVRYIWISDTEIPRAAEPPSSSFFWKPEEPRDVKSR